MKKNSYPNQITHTLHPPPSKVKWSAPNILIINFFATTSQTLIATFVALKIIHRNAFVANVKKPTVCYAYSLSGRRYIRTRESASVALEIIVEIVPWNISFKKQEYILFAGNKTMMCKKSFFKISQKMITKQGWPTALKEEAQ